MAEEKSQEYSMELYKRLSMRLYVKSPAVGTPPLLWGMHVSHRPLGALGITIRRDQGGVITTT